MLPSPVANLEYVERRRRSAGLSMAELARRSRVGYRKLWYGLAGEKIEPAELERINHVLEQAERSDPTT